MKLFLKINSTILLLLCLLLLIRIVGRSVVHYRTATTFSQTHTIKKTHVLIRGTHAQNPVLIFIDDTTLPTLPYARTSDAPLLKTFTTVHYDRDSTTLLPALLDTLAVLYPNVPRILVGHGDGTSVCLATPHQQPIASMILINPPYDAAATGASIFAFALNKARSVYNKQAVCELITTDAKTGLSQCGNSATGHKWMDILGGRYAAPHFIQKLRVQMFFNPDLTLAQMYHYLKTPKHVPTEPTNVPAERLTIPLLLITGTHNKNVWENPTKKYYDILPEPKMFLPIETAGFAPQIEQPKQCALKIIAQLPFLLP